VAYQLALTESPPPYGGAVVDARAQVVDTWNVIINDTREFHNVDDVRRSFVRPGDKIQLNHQGRLYSIGEVATVTSDGVATNTLTLTPELPLSWVNASFPYKILRTPRRTPAAPVDLPMGSAIVLTSSGYSAWNGYMDPRAWDVMSFWGGGEVMLTFDGTGQLEHVYRGGRPDDLLNPALHPLLSPVRIDIASGSPNNFKKEAMRMLIGRRDQRLRDAIDTTVESPSVDNVSVNNFYPDVYRGTGAGHPNYPTDDSSIPD
jgi:hypothetical protein